MRACEKAGRDPKQQRPHIEAADPERRVIAEGQRRRFQAQRCVVLGILVLGERLSWNEPVGALVVFAGIVLAQGRLRRWRVRGGVSRRR